MKALIIDRQELFRASLRELVRMTGRFDAVLEAKSTSEFVSLATSHDDIALMVAYPASVELSVPDCICLSERLLDDAELLIFRDRREAFEQQHEQVQFLDRSAGVKDVMAALGTDRQEAVAPPIQIAPMRSARPSVMARGLGDARRSICDGLSRRQKEIMAMVAEGLANKEIAARLGIAEGTVKAHIHAVFKALGVTNRTQAVVRYGGELRAAV